MVYLDGGKLPVFAALKTQRSRIVWILRVYTHGEEVEAVAISVPTSLRTLSSRTLPCHPYRLQTLLHSSKRPVDAWRKSPNPQNKGRISVLHHSVYTTFLENVVIQISQKSIIDWYSQAFNIKPSKRKESPCQCAKWQSSASN